MTYTVDYTTQPAQPTAPAKGDAAQGIGAPVAPAPPTPPLPAIPDGGGRLIIDRHGGRTVVTSAALPPELMMLAERAEETAFGLMGLLAAIIILGPFARMWARRIEKRSELGTVDANAQLLQQQLHHLQESVDAMSIEVERISESQRFQSKLLHESRGG